MVDENLMQDHLLDWRYSLKQLNANVCLCSAVPCSKTTLLPFAEPVLPQTLKVQFSRQNTEAKTISCGFISIPSSCRCLWCIFPVKSDFTEKFYNLDSVSKAPLASYRKVITVNVKRHRLPKNHRRRFYFKLPFWAVLHLLVRSCASLVYQITLARLKLAG